MPRAHGMKSDEKLFFLSNLWDFLKKNVLHVVIDRYFSLFLKGLKIFAITDSPFNTILPAHDKRA